jgi:hypothetical protein
MATRGTQDQAKQPEPDKRTVLLIDGEEYDLSTDDLTFGEQRKLRTFVRQLADDDDLDITEAAMMDFLPALVTVIKQRTDPDFTPADAERLRFGDVLRDVDPTPSPVDAPKKSSGTRS